MRSLPLLMIAALAAVGCGDNIGPTDTLQMCLINALENCEARTECGLFVDDLEAVRCPGELRDACCAEYGGCEGTLPITVEERFVCIEYIEDADCAVIEQGQISIDTCLGW